MNLYITGHGFQMLAAPDAVLTVPSGFQLKFYCKRKCLFDSSWEGEIVARQGDVADFKPEKGQSDWEVETISAGGSFLEHVLTRPGKMKTFRSLSEMKEIKVPMKGVGLVNEPLVDGDILCIKGGAKEANGNIADGEPFLSLSALMVALAKRVPAGAIVHWCACRSKLTDAQDAIEQARSPYLGKIGAK